MIFRRYGQFTGGIDLPDEKDATLESPIVPWRRIERLCVPLGRSASASAQPLFRPAQRVSAGERIAASDAGGADVFAPLAGTVASLTKASVVTGEGLASVPAVELTDLSAPSPIMPLSPTFDWRSVSPQTLRGRIGGGGLTGPGSSPLPLEVWVRKAFGRKCRTLVLNAMENQPYVTADHRLLVEHGAEVIRGLAMLGTALQIRSVLLAADIRRIDDYREIIGPARMYGIERIALPHKYPIGLPPMLTKVLTRREMPPGGGVMDIGVAVVDVSTCFALYRWVVCGQPQTHRVATVAGERAPQCGNFWIPFGLACRTLVAGAQEPIICGGPMDAVRCGSAVATAATNAVLALDAPLPAPPGPCIRCGWCTDHCPARLNVAALNDAFELGLLQRARRLGARACVECGVCSYVCPARLPLTARVKQLKRTVGRVPTNRAALASTPKASGAEGES